jgi:hypothetical protein
VILPGSTIVVEKEYPVQKKEAKHALVHLAHCCEHWLTIRKLEIKGSFHHFAGQLLKQTHRIPLD